MVVPHISRAWFGRPAAALIGVVLAGLGFGLCPAAASAAPPAVTDIRIANLIAGVPASVSFDVDDESAQVSCQWQTAGTGTSPGTWVNVGGATACDGYSAPSQDSAKWHRLLVTATNAEGQATFPSRAYRLGGEVLGMASCGLKLAFANGTSQSLSVPAPGNGAFCYSNPDLSPDGLLVVFERQQTSQAKWDLWLVDGSRTGARQLTNTPSLNESDARFSPDGTRIAFRRYQAGLSTSTIVVYDLTSGVETELGTFAEQTGNSNGLEWLDDTRLVFLAKSRQGGTFAGEKWRYYTGWPGLGTGRTASAAVTCPYSSGSQECTFIHEVWLLDLTSGAATQVTDTAAPTSAAEFSAIRDYKINPVGPRVSPDGHTLIHTNSQNGRMLKIDTTTWAQTWTTFTGGGYAWRSDGGKIFWSKTGWDSPGVYTVNPDLSGSAGYMTGYTFSVYDFGFLNPAPPPVSVAPPTITGLAVVGETLSGTSGEWVPAPSSVAYQWLRCDLDGEGCADIPGATNATYPVSADDVGRRIRLRVTAMGTSGSGSAPSLSTDVVMTETAWLLAQYAPELRYDAQETYRADAVDTITENYQSGEYSNYLKNGSDEILAAADPGDEAGDLSLDYLGDLYLGGTPATSDDYLDEADDPVTHAQQLHGLSQYANRAYGQVVSYQNGEKVVQYWLFYYYNPKTYLGIGAHEGDWEMVQVHLDAAGAPVYASYSQHGGGERCEWAHVQHTQDGRPIVYVAEGSHASYFSSGYHLNGGANDWANGDGDVVVPTVIDVSSLPEWLEWPGRFGASADRSPRGPAQHVAAWSDPWAWSDTIDDCTEEQERPAAGNRWRPPAPQITAHRDEAHAVIDYCLPGSRRPHVREPWTLLTSIDPAGEKYPPLTLRSQVTGRCGRVVQDLGAGKGSFIALASIVASNGMRSETIVASLE